MCHYCLKDLFPVSWGSKGQQFINQKFVCKSKIGIKKNELYHQSIVLPFSTKNTNPQFFYFCFNFKHKKCHSTRTIFYIVCVSNFVFSFINFSWQIFQPPKVSKWRTIAEWYLTKTAPWLRQESTMGTHYTFYRLTLMVCQWMVGMLVKSCSGEEVIS